MFNRDNITGIDVYILTAYFVDPKTICQSNRDIKTFKQGDIGTGLWLQNGTDPIRDSFSSPMEQSDVNKTKWVQGSCFPSMGKRFSLEEHKFKIKFCLGVHHWYDNRLDSDCDTYFPAFLMYNKGKLTGFGWATIGLYEYTKRTEFPPLSAIEVSLMKFLLIRYTFLFFIVIFDTCTNMCTSTIS
jgi:charged multivesicular body protein 7